jgi:Protein of unknown function (DUF3047)
MSASSLLWGCASSPTGQPADPGSEWQPFLLPGKRATEYKRVHIDGRDAWHARSLAAASFLRRRVAMRVTPTTEAEFSWRIDATIAGADLCKAETADSPVRVVFAFTGDVSKLSLRTRMQYQFAEAMTGEAPPYATLMYVWDNHAEIEAVLTSARSDRIRKVVLESGPSHVRQWRHYRRNLTADFRRAFGEDPGLLVGIALMTDADNTGASAEACYGDILLHS